MNTRDRLLAALDPDYRRTETTDQLADRILATHPEPDTSTLAGLVDRSNRPVITAHELLAWARTA